MKQIPLTQSSPSNKTGRLGFYYYPDALHYRQADLDQWLPVLSSLGASWIILQAPTGRAIPETFIQGMLQAEIEPVLHFDLPLGSRQLQQDVLSFFETYARWGVHYVVIFDHPNLRTSWPVSDWAQADLVEQFLDQFLPIAESAVQAGLTPVFPPLTPGGDYWDLAFLKAALLSIQRRGKQKLIEKLVLSCEAWAGNRPLDWGAGGPESWPQSRPYYTPAGSQDQLGFHIYEWYLATTQAALGETLPIIILRGGSLLGDHSDATLPSVDETLHTARSFSLAQKAFSTGAAKGTEVEIPVSILCCNFWLLAATDDSPHAKQAWFRSNGNQVVSRQPVVLKLQDWVKAWRTAAKNAPELQKGAIHHYLLLPLLEPNFEVWQIEKLLPFIHDQHPTIGFSIAEASYANRVTIAGGVQIFPEETILQLCRAGCKVERILPDGTLIASTPAG